MDRIAIIDICGTIFRSNTTFDFVDYVHRDDFRYKIVRKFTQLLPIKIILALIYRCLKVDVIRKWMIGCLKGLSISELYSLCEGFYDDYLLHRINLNVISRIKSLQANVILVSATLEPIAETIYKRLNADDFYASELDFVDEITTGKLSKDLLGVKLEKIVSEGYSTPFLCTVSNDFTDLPLFLNSSQGIIITKSKNQGKWQKIIKRHALKNIEMICID